MTVLEPETTVEQELGRREDVYQLELAKDECVSVIVEQP